MWLNDIVPLRCIIILIHLHSDLVLGLRLFDASHFPMMAFVLIGEDQLGSTALLKGDLMLGRVEKSPTFEISLEVLVDAEHIRPHELLSTIKLALNGLDI